MPRTIGQCIAEARSILQDTATPFRYADADLYGLFTSAMADTRRLRPDLFIATLLDPYADFAPDDSGEAFPISEAYWTAIVNYLVGRAELRDDEANADSRAAALISAFKAALTTNLA